jgi:serpin B
MTDAFGAADFSGITSTEALMLQEVVQKAYIAVDEKGTETAAATTVMGDLDGGAPPMPKQVQLDRPFLFFIRDLPTQALLFMGQVVEPPPQ